MASGGPGDGDRDGPRLPKDMKGLLRYCAETANSNPSEEPSNFQPMDPEKKEWLQKALDSMTVSPVQEMKKGIDIIQDQTRDVDDKIQALEGIVEWCDHIDFAMDFHKIGGFAIFPTCFDHDEAELRWMCLDLIATLVQNNPYCQEAVLADNLLPTLLDILDKDTDPTVKTKALYAVSCLTRDNEKALDLFLANNGFSFVMRAMQTDIEKLKIKSAFMLSAICTDNDQCKDILCDMGMLHQLVGHLSEEHSQFQEHVLSALLTIVRGHTRSLQELSQPELNLNSLLQERKQTLEGNEQYLEERQYVQELLDVLNTTIDDQHIQR